MELGKISFTQTCIKIKDVNRVIKIDTLFFTPQYENIINETDKIKDLDIFFDNELSFIFQR